MTNNDYKFILEMTLLGLSNTEIAEKLAVNKQTISRARNRQPYRKLEGYLAADLRATPSYKIEHIIEN